MSNGRIEAEIVVPTGGWDFDLDEPAGATGTVTVPAGTYTWATFLTAWETALDAVGDWTYTASISDGEGGTGKLTLSASGGTFTLELADADPFTLIGHTGDMAPAATSFTGAAHVRGMWLPDGPPLSLTGLGDDLDESDETVAESPDGTVWRLVYQRKSVQRDLRYQGISRARCRIAGELVAGESFQQFWRDVIQGDKSYFSIGKVRIFPDADVDGTSTQYYVGAGLKDLTPAALKEGWLGAWTITIPRLVKV